MNTSIRKPLRVLFLCTHNSARSQIAEALLIRRGREEFEVASAGTDPDERVHPQAVEALGRVGIDWTNHTPKALDDVLAREWDLVITVCDRARESCPALPGRPVVAHWGLPDPTAIADESARQNAFWETLTVLSRRIDLLMALGRDRLSELAAETNAGIDTELDARS